MNKMIITSALTVIISGTTLCNLEEARIVYRDLNTLNYLSAFVTKANLEGLSTALNEFPQRVETKERQLNILNELEQYARYLAREKYNESLLLTNRFFIIRWWYLAKTKREVIALDSIIQAIVNSKNAIERA
jgi:hypothetical protein